MAPPILILADDLSGAADCAVACRRAGMAAEVALEPAAATRDVEALALDLDTRSRPAEEARARNLAARGCARGRVLYRKIDSTLRGHVGLEIAATLELAGPGALAIVCPAYPVMGRTVRDGAAFVGGTPLEETEIWRRDGAGSPRLGAMLGGAGVANVELALDVVRSAGLAAALAAAKASGARAAVCDAETEDDLEALVAAGLALGGAVWAGSAGLTIPLARALASGPACAEPPPRRRAGPTLVVVGSASRVSHDQLAALAQDPRTHLVALAPAALLRGEDAVSGALEAAMGDAAADVVAVALGADAGGDGHALSLALGRLLAPVLHRFGAAVLTGGETARAVLGAAGVAGMRIHDEIEPGVVLSSAAGLPVVTKAGSFGRPGSLVRAAEALRALA